jgi:hypothetical protein
MAGVHNSHIWIEFDLTHGIAITRIFDPVLGRDYLPTPPVPREFFEFSANNGPVLLSDSGIFVTTIKESLDGSSLQVVGESSDRQLGLEMLATLAADSVVAFFQLTITNLTSNDIFFRIVLPKIQGLALNGNSDNMMGTVPKEAGSVVSLSSNSIPVTLGMPFDITIGLPTSFNNMELASIYDGANGGGLFFCDVDGELDNGISPLQFNLSAKEVVGFWITDIPASTDPPATVSVQLPRLGVGVHHSGDWHQAVDFYTTAHRPRWTFPETPAWFRNAGAIYCPYGGGAGGIYLALPGANLSDGAIWTSWDGNSWQSGGDGKWPQQITPAGFTPADSPLVAIKQNANQVTVFACGLDGAVWATWESNDGPWHNNRNGLIPAQITPPSLVAAGAPLAAAQQGGTQWDVFFTNHEDGSVWVTWESGDGFWTDGQAGRPGPAQIVPPGYAPANANLAAALENDDQLDLFFAGKNGAILVTQVVAFGGWSTPVSITPPNLFPEGTALIAIQQNDTQLNVFAVDNLGTIMTTWKTPGTPWQNPPMPVSPAGFTTQNAHLAAAKQSPTQLDVFVVGLDGAVHATFEQDDGPWTDGFRGRNPVAITPAGWAPVGSPLAVANLGPNQLNVFFNGINGGVYNTFERDNGPWFDGLDGRPNPVQVTPFAFTSPSAGLAAIARSDTHMDVFFAKSGRIRSFVDLPILLKEAVALGTNILYLFDYWEGSDMGNELPYANKGEYLPRLDLGGPDAFRAGIDLVHQDGGRVLVYVEPFIIFVNSILGSSKTGLLWAGRDEAGNVLYDYPANYDMVAPFAAWQQQVVDIVTTLIGYGVDGIFLDSYGWQMNRPMKNNAENIQYSAKDYALAVLTIVDRVRAVIQSQRSDAVVLGETTAGPIARNWDGGLNADFGFGNIFNNNLQSLTASPVRYGIPEVHIFGNGVDMNGLHQIYAAGHGLALCSYFPGSFMFDPDNAAQIKTLVTIRQSYADTLIHGIQINQPPASDPTVIAYQYLGTRHRMITIVNTGTMDPKPDITIPSPDPGGVWEDLLTGQTFVTVEGVLHGVSMPAGLGSLRVLLRHPHILRTKEFES